jgi:hypothetical protein
VYTNLTKENIKLFAARVYDNPCCDSHLEFEEDYLRIKYLKTILNKYINNKKINVRILVNHIICIQNVFPGEATAKILFVEMEENAWNSLATILFYLSLMPDKIIGINGKNIFLSSIQLDMDLLQILKEL